MINTDIFIILGYICLQLGIGFWVSRFIQTENDYYLAGRQNRTWLVTFSAFATWFGAETCMGTAGAIYSSGLAGGRADPMGYTLCLLIFALLLSRKLWNAKITTLSDLFKSRYGREVEVLAAFVMIPTSLLWGAAQVRALGNIVSNASDLNLDIAIALATAVVIIYVSVGGLLADALSDVIQGVIIIVSLVTLTIAIFVKSGLPLDFLSAIPKERFSFFPPDESMFVQIDRWMVPILGSLVAQELVSRVSSAKSAPVAHKATLFASVLYFLVGCLPVFMGLMGPVLVPDLKESEQLIPVLTNKYLPHVFYILFSGALVSAILSTVDSALLASGALISKNIVPHVVDKLSPKSKVRFARMSVALSGVAAYIFAISAESIYNLVQEASALGSAGVLVALLFALFSNFGGKWSAIMTLSAGMIASILGKFLEWQTPFLLSLIIALVAYVGTAVLENALARLGGVEVKSIKT